MRDKERWQDDHGTHGTHDDFDDDDDDDDDDGDVDDDDGNDGESMSWSVGQGFISGLGRLAAPPV